MRTQLLKTPDMLPKPAFITSSGRAPRILLRQNRWLVIASNSLCLHVIWLLVHKRCLTFSLECFSSVDGKLLAGGNHHLTLCNPAIKLSYHLLFVAWLDKQSSSLLQLYLKWTSSRSLFYSYIARNLSTLNIAGRLFKFWGATTVKFEGYELCNSGFSAILRMHQANKIHLWKTNLHGKQDGQLFLLDQ